MHDLRGHPRSKVSEASSPAAAGNSNRQRAWHAHTPQLGPVLSRSIPHTSHPRPPRMHRRGAHTGPETTIFNLAPTSDLSERLQTVPGGSWPPSPMPEPPQPRQRPRPT